MFKIRVAIPQPVIMELEDFWRRTHQKRLDEAQKAMHRVEKVADNRDILMQVRITSLEKLGAGSRAEADAVIGNWNIETPPVTNRSVEEFFKMAARKDPPFRDDGVGFKDAVILFSSIDYLRGRKGKGRDRRVRLGLITLDSDFDDEFLTAVARNAGVELSVVRGIQVMNEKLTAALARGRQSIGCQGSDGSVGCA